MNHIKGKIHFYTFKILRNSRNQIFSLNLEYNGPNENSPIIIPKKIIDKYDIKQISEETKEIVIGAGFTIIDSNYCENANTWWKEYNFY